MVIVFFKLQQHAVVHQDVGYSSKVLWSSPPSARGGPNKLLIAWVAGDALGEATIQVGVH